MKAQLILTILLVSTVAFASSKKKVKTTKKKEEITKVAEPCVTPTPAKLDPKTITLQGLGSSTGCKVPK